MVINHLEKLFVTNDAATIIKELEVEHPAARMVVMATKMMEQEVNLKPSNMGANDLMSLVYYWHQRLRGFY